MVFVSVRSKFHGIIFVQDLGQFFAWRVGILVQNRSDNRKVLLDITKNVHILRRFKAFEIPKGLDLPCIVLSYPWESNRRKIVILSRLHLKA